MTLADSGPVATRPGRAQPVELPRQSGEDTPAAPNLIGRTVELEALGSAFEAACGGRALGVLVAGDAGIGKSRLVEEFCDRARLRGAVVATGMCVPADGGLPYAPVMGILRTVYEELGHPASAHQLLHSLDGDGSPINATDAAEPGSARPPAAGEFGKTVFFESVLQSLVELSQKSPVVLVFEDLHWVDSGSSQLFDFLVRNLGDARVLTVGTYRVDELPHDHWLTTWFAELGRHARVRQLNLGPLDRADLAILMHDKLGERPTGALLESVWSRSLGNPFFAEELLTGKDTTSLPTALQGVIANRVKQLSDESQNVLAIAAAAGAVVDHRLLAAVADQSADALDTAVAETIDKKLLVVDDSGSGYRFRHALLREAVYAALLPARRQRLHRSLAEALATESSLGSNAPGHRSAELASHWWAAGDWAAAISPSVQAADAAIAVLAYPEASGFLDHALLADERAPEATLAAGLTRATLLEKAAEVAYEAGFGQRAVDLARAAVAAVDPVAEPLVAARRHTLLGRTMWGVNDPEAGFAAYREAIRLLPADPPTLELATVLADEASGYMVMSMAQVGEARAREAIVAARAVGARKVEGHATNTLGCCLAGLGFYDEAISLLNEALVIAEDLCDPHDLNRAYGNLSSILVECGRLDEGAAIMLDGAALGEELWGARLTGAAGNGIDALVRLGRYSEAEQILAQAGTHSIGVCAVSPWTLPSPILFRRGHFDVAEELLATARDMSSKLGDVQQAAFAHGLTAELELERDRPDEAIPHLEQALLLATRCEDELLLPELCAWLARALADQYESARTHGRSLDVDAVRRRCDEVVALVQASIVAREQRGGTPTPRSLAADTQSAAERSRLDQSDPDLWGEAARRWAVARELYPEAYCWWREAEAVLESRGPRARATDALNRAWRISGELAAGPLAARVVRLAQRGRLELLDDVPAPSADVQAATDLGLTVREVEILGQLAAGRSDREISEALFISKKTVSVHVSNVLRKLSVAGRVEAGKIGQAHGLGVG